MGNNGTKEEKKRCPFLVAECIGSECACYIDVTQTQLVLGVARQVNVGICSLPALCMIMSARPQPAPQGFKIPQIYKG